MMLDLLTHGSYTSHIQTRTCEAASASFRLLTSEKKRATVSLYLGLGSSSGQEHLIHMDMLRYQHHKVKKRL
jgi:hypothetical protein